MKDDDLLQPLPEWEDEIGSIESITIDEKRYFFCINEYSILSGLFESEGDVSKYAENWLRKDDGKQDFEAWYEEAKESVEVSEVACEKGERDFFSNSVCSILDSAKTGTKITELMKYHHLWLIQLAVNWGDSENIELPDNFYHISRKIGVEDNDDVFEYMELCGEIFQSVDMQERSDLKELARMYTEILGIIKGALPKNWDLLLGKVPLVQPTRSMSKAPDREMHPKERCYCGSGKKYQNCHGLSR